MEPPPRYPWLSDGPGWGFWLFWKKIAGTAQNRGQENQLNLLDINYLGATPPPIRTFSFRIAYTESYVLDEEPH